MARRYYSSTARRTTLAADINSSVTSLTVAAVSGWPSSFPYTLVLDEGTLSEELVEVSARSGTTVTVTRGVDGTSAVAHTAGATVNHGVSARDFNEPNQFLNEGGTVTGATVVEANSSSAALRITQTGAGNALLVEDSTNPDATPFTVDAGGSVIVGNTSIFQQGSTIPLLQVQGTSNSSAAFGVARFSNDSDRVRVVLAKSRGALGAQGIVSSGDVIANINAFGSDGTNWVQAAGVSFEVDGTPGTNDMPGRLVFSTTADGASSPTERMRITSAGNVGIGVVPNATARLDVSDTNARLRFDLSTTTTVLYATNAAANAYQALRSQASQHEFFTASNERLRIDNAGLITGTGTSLGAWTAYTPTVTSGTGTLTTVSASGYYCQIGKIVHLRARITLTTNGTGATDLRMTMPVAARNVDVRPIGSGRESAITGKQLMVWALQNGSTAYIVFYDNTYPGGDNRSYDLSMTYETN